MILVLRLLLLLSLVALSLNSNSQDDLPFQQQIDNFSNADALPAKVTFSESIDYKLQVLKQPIKIQQIKPAPPTPTTNNILKGRTEIEITHAGQAFVNVLFVYPDSLVDIYPDNLHQRFDEVLAKTNQIYRNSDVKITLKNVGAIKVKYPDNKDAVTALYDLTYLKNDRFYEVHKQRYLLGADLVIFARAAKTSNLGGFSWINGYNGIISDFVGFMYSYISIDHYNYVAAHEIGHNFGLRHSRLQDPFIGATFDYALGYGLKEKYITIMAHRSSFNTENKVYLFSNPKLTCENSPCGVDASNTSQGANAALALNAIRFQAQQLLKSSPNLTPFSKAFSRIKSGTLQDCILKNHPPRTIQYAGQLYSINCPSKSINSLKHLNDFENVHTLNLNNNKITNIESLSGLINLVNLDLSGNRITNISPLFNNQKHWRLINLKGNPVHCWQLIFFDKYQSVDNFIKPKICNPSDDNQDFDLDGINNIIEINNNTNPTINNGIPANYHFERNNYEVYENDKQLVIPVHRSIGVPEKSSIKLAIKDSTASQKVDYSINELLLNFTEHQNKKLLQINIIDDRIFEQNEQFTLQIEGQEQYQYQDNAIINPIKIHINIIDNEIRPIQDGKQVIKSSNSKGDRGASGSWSLYLIFLIITLNTFRKPRFIKD